jgi:hypothetical protein
MIMRVLLRLHYLIFLRLRDGSQDDPARRPHGHRHSPRQHAHPNRLWREFRDLVTGRDPGG